MGREEARRVNEFQFLTAKPVIVVVNAGEDQVDEVSAIMDRLESEVATDGVLCSTLFGKLEMELSEMDPEDEEEFRESLGAGESGLGQDGEAVIRRARPDYFLHMRSQGREGMDGNARRRCGQGGGQGSHGHGTEASSGLRS